MRDLTGPQTREKAAQEIVDSVHGRLAFNVAAYGTAWTGEYEDSQFIAGGVLDALAEAGITLVEHAEEEVDGPHAFDPTRSRRIVGQWARDQEDDT